MAKNETYQAYRPVESFEDIVENFRPLASRLNFHELITLVSKTYAAMEKWPKSFREFCLDRGAISEDGSTRATSYSDGKIVVFAYPFFASVWKLLERRRAAKQYAQAVSWEDLGKEQGMEGVIAIADTGSHITALGRGLNITRGRREARGESVHTIDSLLGAARERYKQINKK